VTTSGSIERGIAALAAGRWDEARDALLDGARETGAPEALSGLGDALFFLGEVKESVQYRERAYATFRRAGRLAEALDCATWLCLTYAMALGNAVAAGGWLARAESLPVDPNDALLRAWLDYCRAILSADTQRCGELLEGAVAAAREACDLDLELCALGELGVVRAKLGDVDAGLKSVDEAMAGAVGREWTSFYTVVMAGCSMMTVCDLLGDLGRAAQWSRAADELMREHGCPYLYAECRIVYGRLLVLTGRWPEAEDELARAAALTRETFPGMHNRTIASLAELRLRQGRLDDTRALIESIEAPIETALAAAGLSLRLGQPASAVTLVERWLRVEADPVAPPIHAGGRGLSMEMARALCLLVEGRLACGELGEAERAEGLLAELASRSGAGLPAAYSAFSRGQLELAAGNHATAAVFFGDSVASFGRLGLPLETARARLGVARAQAQVQIDLAVAEARTALSALDRLGATAEADWAAALVRSWGSKGRGIPRDPDPLTRREHEVLLLLARGLSNQEIAERLYISRRTAAHHVSNLFTKLGVRNRTEAASYAPKYEISATG
jgi:ATP/maltotriose-dependent transcriptional regulator MalT